LIYEDEEDLMKFNEKLMSKFEIIDRELESGYLNMSVEEDEKGDVTIKQPKFCQELIEEFKLTDSKPAIYPSSGIVLMKKDEDEEECNDNYASIIGS
jgi:uncharacterized Fe-S center protein